MRARGSIAALACLALVLASCGGDSLNSVPSPEVVATAESVATDVSFPAPNSTTPQADDDEDEDIVLDGRVFGDGPVGVILAHMRTADQTSWFSFATDLAASGDFTVLTFDFRGYGASTGDKQFDRIDTDLAAAIDYMRQELAIDEVFLVGASMGGTAALVAAARVDVAGVVSISSPGQFPPLDATETVADVAEPKLFITAEDDVPAFRSQAEFWELAVEPKEQYVYKGNAHGTAIFDTADGPDLERRIIAFLTSN